jgi:hypothetical protein
MQKAGLKEARYLGFIDEFPKIIEPLKKFVPSAKKPAEVITRLNSIFGVGM